RAGIGGIGFRERMRSHRMTAPSDALPLVTSRRYARGSHHFMGKVARNISVAWHDQRTSPGAPASDGARTASASTGGTARAPSPGAPGAYAAKASWGPSTRLSH